MMVTMTMMCVVVIVFGDDNGDDEEEEDDEEDGKLGSVQSKGGHCEVSEKSEIKEKRKGENERKCISDHIASGDMNAYYTS